MKKVSIRADGGTYIGMGHIMRTLVLAKELSKSHDVFYICRVDNPLSDRYRIGIDKLKSEGFIVKTVRENYMLLDLNLIEADVLITDSYDVDEEYFNETKKIFKKTVYIDDMNLHYFNVDFLINQNIDSLDFEYKARDGSKLLVGPEYIMLREEFRNLEKNNLREKVTDIMITVGGADPYHITKQILSYVMPINYNLHVVVGPSFEKNNYLKNFETSNVKLYYNANMCEIMKKCDIAISACGSTLYECSSCGIPTMGIIVADNQQEIAVEMDKLGILKNMGWYNGLIKEKFLNELNSLCENFSKRKDMSEKAKSFVDGNGVKRVVKGLGL